MSTWNTCEKDIVQIPSKNIEQTNAIYIYFFILEQQSVVVAAFFVVTPCSCDLI